MRYYENPPYYLTAYGIAVKHGFRGTEEEWVKSLKGPKGDPVLWKAQYESLSALLKARPIGKGGDCCLVGTHLYWWDENDAEWQDAGSWQGPQGERGETGPEGRQGIQGKQGERGEKGERGDPGPRGCRGPAGERGEKGERGDPGPIGPQGPKGCKGDQGPAGPEGPPGPKGETGSGLTISGQYETTGDVPAPEVGKNYYIGTQPPYEVYTYLGGGKWVSGGQLQGPTGEKGEKGDTGEKGERGEQGEKGEKGDTGERGETGDTGPQGPAGRDFAILGYYESLEALESAVPSPEAGDSYGVGQEPPYDIYTWDAVHLAWINNGPIQGPEGKTGPGVEKIERTGGTGGAGERDTYTVTLTDGRTSQFAVYNGADGAAAYICPIVLTVEGWTEEAPYTQRLDVPDVLEDEGNQLIHVAPAKEDEEAWTRAGIRCVGQGDGTLTFTASERAAQDLSGWVAIQDAGNASVGLTAADVATDQEVNEMLDEVFGKMEPAEPEPPVIEPDPEPDFDYTAYIIQAPEPLAIGYDGSTHELIAPGYAVNGEFVYRIGDSGEFSTAIPAASEPGVYEIQYYVRAVPGYASDGRIYSAESEILGVGVPEPEPEIDWEN